MERIWGLIAAAFLATLAFAVFPGQIPSVFAQTEEVDTLDKSVSGLYQAGKYAEAVPVAEQYVALANSLNGDEHPNYANAITWLGRLHRELGRYGGARALFERALAIDEKALGAEDPRVGRDLNNIALVDVIQARYAEAEMLYTRAISIAEKVSQNSADVAVRLNNLAQLYLAQGRNDDAKAPLNRALTITSVLEQSAGRLDIEFTSLVNLAGTYLIAGRHSDAESVFKRIGDIQEQLYGTSHFEELSKLYLMMGGREREAKELAERASSIRNGADPIRPVVTASLNNLAAAYLAQGHYDVAQDLLERALTNDEKAFGPEHPYVGRDLNNLAELYDAQGRYGEAEPLYKRALAIAEKAFGPNHPTVGRALNNLAYLYDAQARYAEAEPLYKRALAIAEKALGPDHPDLALVRSNLGGLHKSRGRIGEAEPLLKSALEINEKVFGPTHPVVANTLAQLGDLYRLEGNCVQSEALFLRARSIIGAGAVREVPMLFGTDRKRDMNQPAVTFGGEREEKLSFGRVVVTVPEPQTHVPSATGKGTVGQTTEARRLAIRCIEVVDDKEIVEAAVHQVDGAKTYPRQALIFVHGYNVSFESASRRAAQIAYDIKFDGATFLFSWPSRERVWGYFSDSDTVQIAADHLRDFLQKIVAETKVNKINFVAHSMGNMVLLRALERIAREEPSLHGTIGEIIEAAPDVDEGVYAHMLKTINPEGGNVTLYASRGDWALWLSGWLRGLARAGYISKDKPLIVPGVDTIDITSAGTSLFALNHDVYASNPILVGDIRRIIEKGERPPDKRTKEFEPVASKDGTYWRLTPAQVETRH